MDLADPPHTPTDGDGRGSGDFSEDVEPIKTPKKLPDDLPTSLDDRRQFNDYGGETEMYDAWQGAYYFFGVVGSITMEALGLSGGRVNR